MENRELIDLLKASEPFAEAPEVALEHLLESAERRRLSAKQELIQQGGTGESIWVLIEGELEVLVDDEVVNRVTLPGAILGEISAVSLLPATATVRATTGGEALSIPRQILHDVMAGHPEMASALLRSMSKYLGRL